MSFGRSSSKELTKDFDIFRHMGEKFLVENQKLFLPEYLFFPNLNIPKFSHFFDNFWKFLFGKHIFENLENFRLKNKNKNIFEK